MTDKTIFLLPGEASFTKEPATISTLLGSCVAVCLYDTRNGWGGMNHYMLPEQTEDGLTPGKYGDHAITSLIKVAQMSGSNMGDLVASIYGGGKVVGHLGSMVATSGMNIGDRNIEVADAMLRQQGIRVINRDVGGDLGRKIHMNSATNEIRVTTIQQSGQARERAERSQRLVGRKAKVLIIDDSATVRKIIAQGIAQSSELEVVGEAENPYDAREKILDLDPDVLCLDIIMPRLDGLTFLRKIMRYKPIPTVIVSTIAKEGSAMCQKVEAAGAVGVIDKEDLHLYRGLDQVVAVLVPKLATAARTPVQKRD
jgi:chemotaxis receptor (MCP) glutamine deamidase CheD/CheY-like chemotaxis protein